MICLIISTTPNIAKVINESIDEYFGGYDNGVKFIAEPGRYFVSASHTLLLNVIGKKDIEESNELELDQLNQLVPLLQQAKSKTIDYYRSKPDSYSVLYGTDLAQDYLNDIIELFKN